MRNTAQAAALDAPLAAPVPRATLVALPVDGPAGDELRELLVRRLAADRLRDLRDDGVTMGYVARMYGVDTEILEQLAAELLPLRTR